MKSALKSSVAVVLILALIGCPSQSTLASLTNILGTSAAQIASLEGNPDLAAKLTSSTAAAVTAINTWKPGTPSQDAVQAINIVIANLNLFPQTGQYAPLILLSLTTAEAILDILQPQAATPAARTAHQIIMAPTMAKEFKARWNAIAPNSASKIR
jgi:hypothetical protein